MSLSSLIRPNIRSMVFITNHQTAKVIPKTIDVSGASLRISSHVGRYSIKRPIQRAYSVLRVDAVVDDQIGVKVCVHVKVIPR